MILRDAGKFAEGMAAKFPSYYCYFTEVESQSSIENRKGGVLYTYSMVLVWDGHCKKQEMHLMQETGKLSQNAGPEDLGDVSCGFEVLPFQEVVWFLSLLLKSLEVGTESAKLN